VVVRSTCLAGCVPVVRDADRKGVFDIASERPEIAKLVRGKLKRRPEVQLSARASAASRAPRSPDHQRAEVAILGVSP